MSTTGPCTMVPNMNLSAIAAEGSTSHFRKRG